MKHLKLAVATRCFAQPLRTSLETAAKLGAEGVQFDVRHELRPADLSETGRRELLHQLRQLGMTVASVTFPVRRPFFDSEQLDARIAGTKSALEFAAQLQARVLTLRIGHLPEDEAAPERDVLLEVVNDLARFGNHVGVALAITPLRDRPATLDAFLQSITAGPAGVNFDPSAFIAAHEDPIEALRVLHRQVLHVQVRDALRDAGGSEAEVPVGRGEVQWDELLALFDEADYRGWFTAERTQGSDKRTDLAHAVQFIRNVGPG